MAAFVSRYASAFADVVSQEKLDTAVLDGQLEDFLVTWEGSDALRNLFLNPAVAVAQKITFLDTLNKKLELAKPLRNLLAVLIKNGRIGQVREVAAAYRAQLQARQGIQTVEIVTARELDEAERGSLTEGVGKLAGGRIAPHFTLDAAILGGTVVQIGSTVYDGSIRGRLERLKEQLTANS
jgi:F-type H+-transporting ATPase subunit delta